MAGPDDDRRIDDWVEGLAGRTPAQQDAAAVRQAVAAVRQAVVEHAAAQPPLAEAAGAQDHAWQQLRFRLRREKLLRRTPNAARWAVAAAVVLAAGTAFWNWQGTDSGDIGMPIAQGEMPVLRGEQPQLFTVKQPREVARRIALLLAEAKARPLAYPAGAAITIDFEWDPAARPDLERNLQHELPALRLRPGVNRIVLRPPA